MALVVLGALFGALLDRGGADRKLEVLDAVLLGLIEGVTEFIPVSSTGHLVVAERMLGITGPAADSFVIIVQVGAMLGVIGVFRHRVSAVLRGGPMGRALGGRLLVAAAPTGIVGLLLGTAVKERLLGPWPVVAGWAAGGVAILAVSGWHGRRTASGGLPLEALRWQTAVVVGLAQCLALWPGTSRSQSPSSLACWQACPSPQRSSSASYSAC